MTLSAYAPCLGHGSSGFLDLLITHFRRDHLIDVNGNLLNPLYIASVGKLVCPHAPHSGPHGNDKKNFAITMHDGRIYESQHPTEVKARQFRDDVVKLVDACIEARLRDQ